MKKAKRMAPELKEQYKTAMRVHSRGLSMARNLKSHGSIHNKVGGHLIDVLEKVAQGNSDRSYYLPKLVGGTKRQYKLIEGQKVAYVKEGLMVVLYKTSGEIRPYTGMPTLKGNPLRRYCKVNGTWVEIE